MTEIRKRPAFPDHLKRLRDLLPEILHILEDGRTTDWYAFVWLEETTSRSVTAARVQNASRATDRGIVYRILAGGRNFEKALNRLDKETLLSEARNFREDVENRIQRTTGEDRKQWAVYEPPTWDRELDYELPRDIRELIPPDADPRTPVHFSPPCEYLPDETDSGKLAAMASALREQVMNLAKNSVEGGSGAELADVRAMIRETVRTHVFVDRNRMMTQTLPITLSYVMGISAKGYSGRSIRGGLGGLEVARQDEESLEEAALVPLRLEKADRIEPGRYRVITGPDVTGVIAHEAFGHTQEGDTCAKGRSIAPGLRESGVRVGNEHATIVNYAGIFSMEGETHGPNGSCFFDHEGMLARPHDLIRSGQLSTPMTDLWSSIRLGVPRTANGKRESWKRPIMTRQTNTYFTPGESTLEEMIGMVSRGFLARHAHGGMEDPKGGSLTAGTEYLEEILDGKLTGKIFLGPSGGHVELSDPVFDLLDRIEAKSRVDHADSIPCNKYGGCGKYHKESVDAGSGGPWILWESVTCG